ncbi:FAD:protein FMN transferase [Microcella sp.]|uniref:FAD:protein FMN transferase n=1 Tax=Microcella sp. TaxID=1913979 RepID=UPI00391DEB6E
MTVVTDAPLTTDRTWALMGGSAHVRIVGGSSAALDEAHGFALTLEQRWSRFVDDSDLTALANADGVPVTVAPETIVLLHAMREGWRETDHDFDPTLLPHLVTAGYRRSTVDPSRSTTLPALAVGRGDLEAMRLDGDEVRLPIGMTLDAGGIGKGLAADLVARRLIAAGALGCLVEIGGDVRVAGQAPDDTAWRIAVDDPFVPGANRGVVRLVDGGIATSSQRKRRWMTESGHAAHHLIDPASGRPAATSIQTVTVIAATAARAEVLTKPGFLRPLDDYLAWLPTRGAAALLIDADGVEHSTPNWSDYA